MNNQTITNHLSISINMTTSHTKILLHVNVKFCTRIFSLTTYTQLDYKQKDCALIKLLCTDTNKTMNEYHPRLYVNGSTSQKITNLCQISTSTLFIYLHMKTNSQVIILKSPPKTPSIHLFTTMYPYKNT